MHGRALGNRGDGRACQCVHAGTFVNTGFRIRLIPRTLRQSNDARNNSRPVSHKAEKKDKEKAEQAETEALMDAEVEVATDCGCGCGRSKK